MSVYVTATKSIDNAGESMTRTKTVKNKNNIIPADTGQCESPVFMESWTDRVLPVDQFARDVGRIGRKRSVDHHSGQVV